MRFTSSSWSDASHAFPVAVAWRMTSWPESRSMSGQRYTTTTTVTDDDPAPNMKHLVIAIDWRGPEGAKSYEVETIFTPLRS